MNQQRGNTLKNHYKWSQYNKSRIEKMPKSENTSTRWTDQQREKGGTGGEPVTLERSVLIAFLWERMGCFIDKHLGSYIVLIFVQRFNCN